MKTRSIQTLLLAATLGLLVTACNNDSDQTVDITKPINVKLSLTTTGTNIPISRAAIGATEFDDDDALGLAKCFGPVISRIDLVIILQIFRHPFCLQTAFYRIRGNPIRNIHNAITFVSHGFNLIAFFF